MMLSEGPNWTDVITALVAIAALAISAITARLSRRQTNAAIDQSTDAQRSADAAKDQAASARDQAEMAKDQAVSARNQAETAARQFALEQRVYRESQEPYVVVDIRPSEFAPEMFLLIIENIGPTIARDIHITADPPFQRTWDKEDVEPFANALIFTQGIPYMPPGRKLEIMFDVGFHLFASDLPRRYRVRVDANGPFGPVEPLTYLIDLEYYAGLEYHKIKTIHQGVQELEKLRKQMEKVAAELERPRRKAEATRMRKIIEERRIAESADSDDGTG
ncbi:hypothetical protein [Streptosporangium sp. NPDC004631]